MPGMYPDDQIVEIFGEQVLYPGLDSITRKFTDGDFSNPLIKPSHIPAETFNLILDNMESLITAMGLDPNNTDTEQLTKAIQKGFNPRVVGEYHSLSFEPTVEQLINWRYLPLDYRIIRIDLYKELCDLMYRGDSTNAAAYFWYKCDENGTRNVNGLYMRVEDSRGLFTRNAGQNAVFKGANNTPYNGGAIGGVILDAIRNISGSITAANYSSPFKFLDGAFRGAGSAVSDIAISDRPIGSNESLFFSASYVVPTAYENRPASISKVEYISY